MPTKNETIPDLKTGTNPVYDSESPADFYQMMAVAWIRLIASVAHGSLLLAMPRPGHDKNDHRQPAKIDKSDEDELLLHVME